MVRAGKLSEDDRVRRDLNQTWFPAREVVGLFHAAGVQQAPSPPVAPTCPSKTATALPPKQIAPPQRFRRLRSPVFATIAAVGLVILLVAGYLRWTGGRTKFPPPQLGSVRVVSETALAALHAERPKEPSIPNLPEGKVQLVPGLERFTTAFSPTLTADLKTIVFAAMRHPGTGYDLYIATRGDVSQPFDTPSMISSCMSPETDAYPTISPDGLELFFVRSDANPQFFFARRESISSEFGSPVQWPVPPVSGVDNSKRRTERPQFVDSLHLSFCAVNLAANSRAYYVVGRSDREKTFDSPQVLPFSNAFNVFYLTEDRQHAFFGDAEGLSLAIRPKQAQKFTDGALLVLASESGPIDGPVWIAPNQDVAFCCSPGIGKELGTGRRLWMIRF